MAIMINYHVVVLFLIIHSFMIHINVRYLRLDEFSFLIIIVDTNLRLMSETEFRLGKKNTF